MPMPGNAGVHAARLKQKKREEKKKLQNRRTSEQAGGFDGVNALHEPLEQPQEPTPERPQPPPTEPLTVVNDQPPGGCCMIQ